jgi:hypothetical protein
MVAVPVWMPEAGFDSPLPLMGVVWVIRARYYSSGWQLLTEFGWASEDWPEIRPESWVIFDSREEAQRKAVEVALEYGCEVRVDAWRGGREKL